MSYSYPKNEEEYWNIVDSHWDKLYDILACFLPRERLATADNLRLSKDPKIARLFNEAWFNAPDSPSIHSIPAWHVLCDLCSESHVLHEDEEEDEERNA